MDNDRLLASLAVFRELYDSEKDIYSIISSFLNEIISKYSLYTFDLIEITEKLNSEFEFELPSAVVNTSLRRLSYLQKIGSKFIVSDFSKINDTKIEEKQKESISYNNEILELLFKFIEDKTKDELSEENKNVISHSFYSFLLDVANGDEYIEYISSFILDNKSNEHFKSRIDAIREGVILYSGLKYDLNLNETGSWNKELTIFIETEILFHIAGYNGELYRKIALDFLNYVSEINRKSGKNLIKLRYFSDVRGEIESFFYKAQHLLEGKETPNPGGTAMITILNGCKTSSDLQNKKSDFYLLLRNYKIEEELFSDYFNPIYHEYNIISTEVLDKTSAEIGCDTSDILKVLNYVSIHRKNTNVNSFENIKYVLLTGNSTTFKISLSNFVKKENTVPLATTLTFLINKFWFKLNRGLGKSNFPKSFDIITKSQIILSKILNNTLSAKFQEYQKQFKDGKLTEEQAIARIVNLRGSVTKPEEIDSDSVHTVLSIISEDSINRYLEENSYLNNKNKLQEFEKQELEKKLKEKENVELVLNEKNKQLVLNKKVFLQNLLAEELRLKKVLSRRIRNLKILIFGLLTVFYLSIFFVIYFFDWNILEKYTYIISFSPIIFLTIYSLVTEKSLNFLSLLKSRKVKFKQKVFKDFDYNEIDILRKDITELEREIV